MPLGTLKLETKNCIAKLEKNSYREAGKQKRIAKLEKNRIAKLEKTRIAKLEKKNFALRGLCNRPRGNLALGGQKENFCPTQPYAALTGAYLRAKKHCGVLVLL